MFCKNCGNEILDEENFCSKCGASKEGETKNNEIGKTESMENYMTLSIVAIVVSSLIGLFSCNIIALAAGLALSIIGCVQASKVDEFIRKGDITQAKKCSDKAKKFSIIGIVVTIVIAAVFFILGVLFFSMSMMNLARYQ